MFHSLILGHAKSFTPDSSDWSGSKIFGPGRVKSATSGFGKFYLKMQIFSFFSINGQKSLSAEFEPIIFYAACYYLLITQLFKHTWIEVRREIKSVDFSFSSPNFKPKLPGLQGSKHNQWFKNFPIVIENGWSQFQCPLLGAMLSGYTMHICININLKGKKF